MNRRDFLVSVAGGAAVAGAIVPAALSVHAEATAASGSDAQAGVLVDTTLCVGCRKCEYACARADRPEGAPIEPFNDLSVLDAPRRMTTDLLTVVNRYPNPAKIARPIYVKQQCMHCVRPGCVSACIVGALHRETNGTVSYDASKCIGCRYCMLACPFEVPTYEYNNAFTPRVSKCTFCYETFQSRGQPPACVQICPTNCLIFATRTELLKLAHAKIGAAPDRYHARVYGETEAGGTAWLYLTSRPAIELGLPGLPDVPVPQLTESLQHGLFKYGIPPLLLYGLLGIVMKATAPKESKP